MTIEDGAPKAESAEDHSAKPAEEMKEPNQSIDDKTEQVDTAEALKEGSTFLKDPYQ